MDANKLMALVAIATGVAFPMAVNAADAIRLKAKGLMVIVQ